MKCKFFSLSSFPRRREPSCRAVFNRIPAFAGMTGLVLLGGCTQKAVPVPNPIECVHEDGTKPYDSILITFSDGESLERNARVFYDDFERPAKYFSSNEKHHVTMARTESYLECLITVNRYTGLARHGCLPNNEETKKLAEESTYELSCNDTKAKL